VRDEAPYDERRVLYHPWSVGDVNGPAFGGGFVDLQIPILLGAIAIVAVTFYARRLGAPAPLLLVLVGVLVSFLPWMDARMWIS
jgi:hypothetical protein